METSSSIIEFAILNKPVIWCNFLKLRWNYKGIFSYRFKKRMDKDYEHYSQIAARANSYQELKTIIAEEIANPNKLSKNRLAYGKKLAGRLDGNASKRIINYLLKNK